MEKILNRYNTVELRQRILASCKHNNESGCWIWTGAKLWNGYGVLGWRRGKKLNQEYAHRASFMAFIGPIPDDHVLHHQCENKACVNFNHLTPMDNVEHLLGHNPHGNIFNSLKTHCRNGHPYSGENLYYDKKKHERICLICKHANWHRWYQKNRKV